METKKNALNFSGVEETALLTIYARALESRSADPILKDSEAERITDRLDEVFRTSDARMARQLYTRSFDRKLTVHIALRSQHYDGYARAYLQRYPDGVIASLGCGMDTRFSRVDNGRVRFFDIDLPESIQFRTQLIAETERYRMIGRSVLDFGWMDALGKPAAPPLFLAEGLFMYLDEKDVRALVLQLLRRFPGSQLVCELTNRRYVEGLWGRLAAAKLNRRLKMGGDARFRFGVDDPRDLEGWGEGITFVEKWFYLESDHPKLGMLRKLRNLKMMRDAQYTACYQLGNG